MSEYHILERVFGMVGSPTTKNDTTDHYGLTYCCCWFLGVACVLPYATLMGSNDFFQLQFGDTDKNIVGEIFMAYNLTNVLTAAALIPLSHMVSPYWRFIWFAIGYMCFIGFMIVQERSDNWTFVMAMAGYCGLSVANMTGAALSYGQRFQDAEGYVKAVFVGRGFTAVLKCIIRIISKLAFETGKGATVYFGTSMSITLAALILFVASSRTEFSRSRTAKKKESKEGVDMMAVFGKIWVPAVIAFLNMYITMLILPVFLINVNSQYEALNETKWISVIITFNYSVSNFLGRKFIIAANMSTKTLCILSVLRISLIVIAIVLYEEVLVNDLFLYAFTAILGFSHGQFGCMAFIRYGSMLQKTELDTGSSWMYLLLMAGSSLAALCGFAAHHVFHILRK